MTLLRFIAFIVGSTVAIAQGPGLKIVVIEGEDAVNIIQQKTAVAPIVEVRDRNDQPVAGAVVSFAIRGGRATFGNARTVTVTTNAAGRAVAAGFTPTARGAVQIDASATFQGQTAAITIAQTNVMTAAQAAAVSGAGGAGGGSPAASTGAAGGAGSGGGLSVTTIGIIGGAAAAGAVVVTKVSGEREGPRGTTLSGSYSGQIVMTSPLPVSCSFVETLTGTVRITLDDLTTATGRVEVSEQSSVTGGNCGNIGNSANDTARGSLSGTPSNLTFAVQSTNPLGGGQRTKPWSFTGQLNGREITGVLTTGDININASGVVTFQGSSPIPITLR